MRPPSAHTAAACPTAQGGDAAARAQRLDGGTGTMAAERAGGRLPRHATAAGRTGPSGAISLCCSSAPAAGGGGQGGCRCTGRRQRAAGTVPTARGPRALRGEGTTYMPCARGLLSGPAMLVAAFLVALQCSLTAESTFTAPDTGHLRASTAFLAKPYLRVAPAFVWAPAGRESASDAAKHSARVCGRGAPFPAISLLREAPATGSSGPRRPGALSLLASSGGGFGQQRVAGKVSSEEGQKHMESARSSNSLVDESGALSAQERRMLGILSRYGKLHTHSEPAVANTEKGSGKATGLASQSVQEQREEMAKDRREEKMALRRRQGSLAS
jgi:hypothetical protein